MASFDEVHSIRNEALTELEKHFGVRICGNGIGFDGRGGHTLRLTLLRRPDESVFIPDEYKGIPLDL